MNSEETVQSIENVGAAETKAMSMRANAQHYATLLICFAIAFPLVKEIARNLIFSLTHTSFFVNLDFLFYPLYALVFLPLIVIIVRFAMNAIPIFNWQETLPLFLLLGLVAFSSILNGTDVETQSYYWNLIYSLVTTAFPFYIVFRMATPSKELFNAMGVAALIGVVAGYVVVNNFMSLEKLSYSQSLAYQILPSAIVLQCKFFHSENRGAFLLYGIGAIAGFGLLLATGTRGPLAVSIIYFIGAMLLPKRFPLALKLGFVAFIAVFGFLIIVNLESIMLYLKSAFGDMGVSVRLTRLYESNTLFVDDGRSSFASLALEAIWANPMGVGVGQDSVVLAAARQATEISGNYPHNLILEIILQYGVFFGPLIILALGYLVLKGFTSGNDFDKSMLAIVFMLGIVPLLISGTYLKWDFFWALLGVCVAIIRPINRNRADIGKHTT